MALVASGGGQPLLPSRSDLSNMRLHHQDEGSTIMERQLQYYRSNCGANEVGAWIGSELEEDPIDEYFLQDDEYPIGYTCAFSDSDTCETIVYRNVNISAPDPLADATTFVLENPCTKCYFEYKNDGLCFFVECDPTFSVECPDALPSNVVYMDDETPGATITTRQGDLDGINSTSTVSPTVNQATMAPKDSPEPSVVQVCAARSRSDSFSSTEYSDSTKYYCQRQTAKKVYEIVFLLGVTNVRHTKFVIGDAVRNPEDITSTEFGQHDEEDNLLDTCEYIIDGTPCNSCRICGEDDVGGFEMDCSNIRNGAVTSCDSFSDAFVNPTLGYFPKLLVLQEGYVHPDTDEPTSSPTNKDDSSGGSRGARGAAFGVIVFFFGSCFYYIQMWWL